MMKNCIYIKGEGDKEKEEALRPAQVIIAKHISYR